MGLGLVRIHQKRFEEAERFLRRCLEIKPNSIVCKYYLENRRKW